MASYQDFQRNFTKNLERAIRRTFGRTVFFDLGNQVKEIILRRTKAGYGVEQSEGNQQRLRALSPDYIIQRRNFIGLDSTTSPRRSNLTFTGQMLDSIGVRGFDSTRQNLGGFSLFFSNSAAESKAEMVTPRRPFFNLTRGDVRMLTRQMRQMLAKTLARL